MSGLRGNMFFAAILIALLLAIVASIISDMLVAPKVLEKNVFVVEVPETVGRPTSKTPKTDVVEPVSAMLETGDIEKGKSVAKKCIQCHTFDKAGAHKIGPNLWDIVGAEKAKKEGYAYSSAAKKVTGVWSYENLSAFLYKPRQYIPGTKMSFAGLKKVADRANLIAYLRTLSDSPQPLP